MSGCVLVQLVGMRWVPTLCGEEKEPNLVHTEAHCNQRVGVLSLPLGLPQFLHMPFLTQPPLLLQAGRHRLCTVFSWLVFTQSSCLG